MSKKIDYKQRPFNANMNHFFRLYNVYIKYISNLVVGGTLVWQKKNAYAAAP